MEVFMFKKELQDTAKTAGGILLFTVLTIAFSYFALRQIFGFKVAFRDFLLYFSWFWMFLVVFYLGSTLFSREKTGKTFEYVYSFPVPRWKVLVYKLLPPALAILIFAGLYFFFNGVLYHNTQPMSPLYFLVLLVLIFLFSVSMSLMYKHDSTTFISNLFAFMIIFIVITLTVLSVNYSSQLEEPRLAGLYILPFAVISLALFTGFAIRFKRFDISNMPVLSWKNVSRVMIPAVILFLLFIGINQVDTNKPTDAFSMKDLAPARFDKSNGFYRLWTLTEPPGTDIQSDEVINKYRRLFDPAYDNQKYFNQWNYHHFREKFAGYFDKISINLDFKKTTAFDKKKSIFIPGKNRDLDKIKSQCQFLLERYRQLVDTPLVEDFSLPRRNVPSFNYLALLRVATLYLAVNAVDAVDGRWEQGISNILSNITFARRLVKGSRTFSTASKGKSLTNISLQLLAQLMNRDDCPRQVFKQVMEGLPPLKPDSFSIGGNLVFEYLSFAHLIEEGTAEKYRGKNDWLERLGRALFLQKNRTLGYMNRFIKKIKYLDETPPHRWQTGFTLRLANIVKTPGGARG